ncbi:MAG: flagellar biosynthesis protein FlhB [Chloroherpetonaceae bacterium]|nr:flagellar biosynthesis protein FlhB [Chthonomonadaceae bacterium]MDW8207170.1 flagellar biosynthesis protein FlhB [Chloroherpetonaceae bacterium]
MAGGEERTEAATPKRRGEARRRGEVARSVELTSIVVLLGLLFALGPLGSAAGRTISAYFTLILSRQDLTRMDSQTVMALGAQAFQTLLRAFGPLALVAALIGVVINLVQVGPLWATERLRPDFNRINPLVGAQRFFSAYALVELVKSCLKIGLIGYIAWSTVQGNYPRLIIVARMETMQGVAMVLDVMLQMAFRIVTAMLVLAALDYAFQRYQHEKQLRMTRDEVKQEFRQMEGSPQLKSRIRARQREIARKRMMAEVPRADVVITNPTHFAVALRYDPAIASAPVVVAKGQDLLAQKIRELAQTHDVPIVQNPPLARALYRQVDLGKQIPPELYAAVAEVLAFVYQINRARRERMERAMATQ